MEDGLQFHHEGEVNEATFEITLKKYLSDPGGFSDLMKYADENQVKNLTSIHMPPETLFGHADYFVVVDVTYSSADGMETFGHTKEMNIVNQAVLDSLRLSASKGIDRFLTYHWRGGPHPEGTWVGGTSSTRSSVTPYLFSLLGRGSSVFSASEFDTCRAIIDILLSPWDDNNTFDRVLEMAMSYHEVTSTFKEPKHSFLLLMVVFEALFEGRDEETPIAVSRLSQLLARDRTTRQLIHGRFTKTSPVGYTKIRDSIAHGDVNLESDAVKESYSGLYHYITSAIIELLLMKGAGVIDPDQDFYKQIDRVSKEQYERHTYGAAS